jgi:hypothetical protein
LFIIQFQHSLFFVHYSISKFLVPCSLFNFNIPCSLFKSNSTHMPEAKWHPHSRDTSESIVCGDTNDGHIVHSSFNFNIPCSLFIIQIKLNSQAGGQMVSSLARHEREHRLWGYAQGNYNF